MDDVDSDSNRGKDFDYNGRKISFELLKKAIKICPRKVERMYRGFTQTLIYSLSGESFDSIETWNNYTIFLNNLDLLNFKYDLVHKNLVQKIYEEELAHKV